MESIKDYSAALISQCALSPNRATFLLPCFILDETITAKAFSWGSGFNNNTINFFKTPYSKSQVNSFIFYLIHDQLLGAARAVIF